MIISLQNTIILYVLNVYIYTFQDNIIKRAFYSESPLLYYIFLFINFNILSISTLCINRLRKDQDDQKEKHSKDRICLICSKVKSIREKHCKYCEKCVDNYVFHSHILNVCITDFTLMWYILFLFLNVVWSVILILIFIHSLFSLTGFVSFVLDHSLMLILQIPHVLYLIQSSISLYESILALLSSSFSLNEISFNSLFIKNNMIKDADNPFASNFTRNIRSIIDNTRYRIDPNIENNPKYPRFLKLVAETWDHDEEPFDNNPPEDITPVFGDDNQ